MREHLEALQGIVAAIPLEEIGFAKNHQVMMRARAACHQAYKQ